MPSLICSYTVCMCPEDILSHCHKYLPTILSHNVEQRTFWHVRPTKIRINLHIHTVWSMSSFCAETLHPWLSKNRIVKIPMRLHGLRGCASWSESTLGAHDRRYIFWRWGANYTDYIMSRDTAFPTRLHVCPAKTQISLHFRAVWSDSLQGTLWAAKDPKRH